MAFNPVVVVAKGGRPEFFHPSPQIYTLLNKGVEVPM